MSTEAPDPTAIVVKNVSKEFNFSHGHEWTPFGRWNRSQDSRELNHQGYLALDDISFTVGKGETVGVLGKNGAGKSTLLQIITGVLQPSLGDVQIEGRIGALLELGAGFNPELTGRENIELAGAVLGMSPAQVRLRADEIIEFADIGEFIDHPVKTYSSGMLVRVAFSQQIHMDPDVLVIDEALSVGDMFFQQKCLTKIRDVIERGVTVFFVSHSLNAVKSLCRRAILLEKGKLVADGPADVVCEMYQNSLSSTSVSDLAAAIASTQMNLSDTGTIVAQTAEDIALLSESEFNSTIASRSGGGEVTFTGFAVLGNDDRPTRSIERAGVVKLRLQFRVNQDIPRGSVIGVLLRDAHGVDLLAFNMDFYESHLPAMSGGTQIYSYDILTTLPLAQGRYSFHCGIKPSVESSYFYDRCFNVGVLEIESNPISWGQYGGRLLHSPREIQLSVSGEMT